MKAPERTTYIWKIEGDERRLNMVCPSLSAAARFLVENGAKNCSIISSVMKTLHPHVDTDIPIGNAYILTSYLKWKTIAKQQQELMIEAAIEPKHLRFTGFNYKFKENEASF
jgi:hypothetical protein